MAGGIVIIEAGGPGPWAGRRYTYEAEGNGKDAYLDGLRKGYSTTHHGR